MEPQGESAPLDDKEKLEVIGFVIRHVDERVPVIAGTGSNCTRHAVELSKEAVKLVADALLQVTPYYNKTSQEGLVRHFMEVADHVDIPIFAVSWPGSAGSTAGCRLRRWTGKKGETGGNLEAGLDGNLVISKEKLNGSYPISIVYWKYRYLCRHECMVIPIVDTAR